MEKFKLFGLIVLAYLKTQRVQVPKWQGFRSQNPYCGWFLDLGTLLFGYLDPLGKVKGAFGCQRVGLKAPTT